MSVRAAHSNQACRPAPGGGHRTDEGAHHRLQATRAWPWPTGPETGPDLARTTPTAAGRRPTSIAAGPPLPRRARLLRFPAAPPSSADERRRPACSLGGANPARISPAAARPCCPPPSTDRAPPTAAATRGGVCRWSLLGFRPPPVPLERSDPGGSRDIEPNNHVNTYPYTCA
jgi:hypothetical protein